MTRFDLAVIGGGPGGYVAAIRAAQLGLKVCIIEKEKLGGVCLNWGCIPTKSLIKNAEVYSLIKHSGNYGIKVQNISVDFKKNVKRSRDIAQRLSKGIEFLMKKNKIKHLNGIGRLKSKNNIEVNNQSWFTKGLKKFSNFDVNMEVDRFHLNNSSLQSELISTATQVLNNELM